MDDKALWKPFVFAGGVVFLAGGLTVLAEAAGVLGWLLVVLGGITLHAGLVGAAVAGPLRSHREGRGEPDRALTPLVNEHPEDVVEYRSRSFGTAHES